MSSLLEQAIVDATALRQAAIKSAEKDLVEKYSHQIKEAVDKLLEQEEQPEPSEDPMDVATSLEKENVPSDLSKEKNGSKIEKQLIKKVPDSYMKDTDSEMIEIDFSELSKETPEVESEETMQTGGSAMPVAPVPALGASPMGAAPAPSAGAAMGAALEEGYDEDSDANADEGDSGDLEETAGYTMQPEAIDEEEMLEFYTSDLEETNPSNFGGGPEYIENLEEKSPDMEEELLVSMDEEDEQYDEEISVGFNPEEQEEVSMEPQYGELEEEVTVEVDTGNVPTGHRGAHAIETREAVTNELAHKKDDKHKLKLKKLQKAVEESDKAIANAKEVNESLRKQNLELKDILRSLKEHIEVMNLSNAKLLYTNRALEDASLNERQKKTIVESISRTETVEAAKIAFETLQSAVQSAGSEIKAPKSLNEAVSRSSSPFLVRPRASQEMNSYSERMKKLAGINKD